MSERRSVERGANLQRVQLDVATGGGERHFVIQEDDSRFGQVARIFEEHRVCHRADEVVVAMVRRLDE